MVAIICVFQQKRKHYELMYLIYIYTYIYIYVYIYIYISIYIHIMGWDVDGSKWRWHKKHAVFFLASKEYQMYGGRSTRIEGIVWEIKSIKDLNTNMWMGQDHSTGAISMRGWTSSYNCYFGVNQWSNYGLGLSVLILGNPLREPS